MVEAAIGLAPVLTFLLGTWVERRYQRRQLDMRDAVITDLHNRLAARSYAEYEAYHSPVAQEGPIDSGRRLVADDTGLMVFDAPDE